MQELISQLARLYLPHGMATPEWLPQHLDGGTTRAAPLAQDDAVRAIVVTFTGADAWERLCAVANALQGELALPAPAVSIDGATGFRLWLSLGQPVPVATAQRFLELLCAAYCPEVKPGRVGDPVELPPYRHATSRKWAAFIHPGMGASFADEPALEMPPPGAGQVAFLQGLDSIDGEQFQHALAVLQGPEEVAAPMPAPVRGQSVPDGLLLKDATLEDIVRLLHARGIEPTFRHLLR